MQSVYDIVISTRTQICVIAKNWTLNSPESKWTLDRSIVILSGCICISTTNNSLQTDQFCALAFERLIHTLITFTLTINTQWHIGNTLIVAMNSKMIIIIIIIYYDWANKRWAMDTGHTSSISFISIQFEFWMNMWI